MNDDAPPPEERRDPELSKAVTMALAQALITTLHEFVAKHEITRQEAASAISSFTYEGLRGAAGDHFELGEVLEMHSDSLRRFHQQVSQTLIIPQIFVPPQKTNRRN